MTRTLQVEELEYFGKRAPREGRAQTRQHPPAPAASPLRHGVSGAAARTGDGGTRATEATRRTTLRRLEAEIGPGIVKETLVLVPMFEAIAAHEGRENACPVTRSIVEEVAPYRMRATNQVDDLKQCDGDAFDNFGAEWVGTPHGRLL